MAILIRNILLSPDEDENNLQDKALALIGKKEKDLVSFRILRQSVDARKKQVRLVYQVALTLENESGISFGGDVDHFEDEKPLAQRSSHLKSRPVIVGTGPCGLFAALTLARAGATPLILERGAQVEKRTEAVEAYWNGGPLSPDTNVQFGEGGAGTFSDGKLTTRISDARASQVLSDFHLFGADADILYKAKPHIGTDVLREVIQNIRHYLISLGCEFQFETALIDIKSENGYVKGITTSRGDYISCEHLILAIGHSARDTYEMLFEKGISMMQKPFSVGVRIEHLQSEIDRAMYGDYAGHPRLGPAEYQLSYREAGDACYSFCMCPGGVVVAAASEPETIVTNGMSYHSRNGQNANSALCVNVDERYFDSAHPLAGVDFQRKLEKKAFIMTKGAGAPVMTVGGLMEGKTGKFGRVTPSYTGQAVPVDMSRLFPEPIVNHLKSGLAVFDRKISGFAAADSILTGPETRTSAPVRILRDEYFESVSLRGLYPAGEGAGYAGGIMSAAVDGIRVAERILEQAGRERNE